MEVNIMKNWQERLRAVQVDKDLHNKVREYSSESGIKLYKIYELAVEEYLEKRNWQQKVVKK